MNIIREFGINGDKRKRYNLTESQGQNLMEFVGQRLEIAAYVLIEEEDRGTSEMRKGLKVQTKDGEIIGTRSQSFIEGFLRFLDLMETDEIDSFEVVQARSKAGRNYLTFKA